MRAIAWSNGENDNVRVTLVDVPEVDARRVPLKKDSIKSIAIIGPDAHPAQPGGGGSGEAKPFTAVSYLQGLTNYLGDGAKVYYSPGIPTLEEMAKHTEFTAEPRGGTFCYARICHFARSEDFFRSLVNPPRMIDFRV